MWSDTASGVFAPAFAPAGGSVGPSAKPPRMRSSNLRPSGWLRGSDAAGAATDRTVMRRASCAAGHTHVKSSAMANVGSLGKKVQVGKVQTPAAEQPEAPRPAPAVPEAKE